MKDRVESLIIYNLMHNETYTRRVLPFIHPEYFKDRTEKLVFIHIKEFINKYNALPSNEAIVITVNKNKNIKDTDYKNITDYLSNLDGIKNEQNDQWLIDNTEEWCKDMAIQNAILSSIKILDNPNAKLERGTITKLVSDALAVGFNANVGHDYFEDSEKQFDFYHRVDKKVPFDIEMLNKITNGGLTNKTLTVVVAGTGTGKTNFGTHAAASWLSLGKNVLYVTLEMSEERIVERIDANLLDIDIRELEKVSKDTYDKKISKLKNNIFGKLIIKEFPTCSAHIGHLRHLFNELYLKKNFKPDIVVIDYLNIMASSRIKQGGSTSLYTYVKAIADELHGLATEFDIPILTFSQLNRQGQHDTDADFESIADSHGTGMAADLIFALISTEELDKLNQIMVKQIKNRYADVSKNRRFVMGVDRSRMRFYNVEQSAQKDIADSGQEEDEKDVPGFDKTKFGKRMKKQKDYSKLIFGDSDFKDPNDDDPLF